MKHNFDETSQTDLIEAEHNSIEQSAYPEKFVLKGKSIQRNTLAETITAGYGNCRACNCKGYISKHDGSHECKTCNHHFDRHN